MVHTQTLETEQLHDERGSKENPSRRIARAIRIGSTPLLRESLAGDRKGPRIGAVACRRAGSSIAQVAAHLNSVPVPFALKTRVLANMGASDRLRNGAGFAPLAVAGAAGVVSSRTDYQRLRAARVNTPASVTDYEQEMISFCKARAAVSRNAKSRKSGRLSNGLQNAKPRWVTFRQASLRLRQWVCRILSFRGYPVTLICFLPWKTLWAHLFIVDRAALSALKPGKPPVFSGQDDWTVATWADQHYACMVCCPRWPPPQRGHYLPHA